MLDSSVDPRFNDDHNRPTLAQSFTEISTGEDLTLVMNHLKSKGSCPTASADPANADHGDGAGCWNQVRSQAAAAILDWINAGDAGNGDPDVVLMGDMNSYAKEDPIDVFTGGGFSDLSAGGYSYVFDGQWGYLDYALTSPSLLSQVTGITEFHINSDEVPVLDYNTEFKTPGQIASLYAPDMYRTSDHDPVVLGIALEVRRRGASVRGLVHHPRHVAGRLHQSGLDQEHRARRHQRLGSGLEVRERREDYRSVERDKTQTGADVSVSNVSYNGHISPGSRITFGFVGSTTAPTTEPGAFTLNGKACAVVP